MSLLFLLKVGAVVEAKNTDGQFMEAVITKLTDASFYTVGKCFYHYLSLCAGEVSLPKQVFNQMNVYFSSSF